MRAGLAVVAAVVAVSAGRLAASDPPHWVGAVETTNCTSACHTLHQAAGGQLTQAAQNAALCQSCLSGVTSALPIENAGKAMPNLGQGVHHAFGVAAVNAAYDTQVPLDQPMSQRVMNGNIVCSTCHNQHDASSAKGGRPRISAAGKVLDGGGTGTLATSGTFSGAAGVCVAVRIDGSKSLEIEGNTVVMDTQKVLPSSMQKVPHSTPVKLILGFLMIIIPWAIGEIFIISLPLTSLWRSILATGFSLPVAFGADYILVHFIERREMTEFSLPGAAWETTQGILIGMLLIGTVMAILALTGAYTVLGTNSLNVLLPPLFFAVKAAVLEEILFRGVVFRLVERSLGSWLALVISAAIFGGLHLTNANATLTGAIAIMLAIPSSSTSPLARRWHKKAGLPAGCQTPPYAAGALRIGLNRRRGRHPCG